MKKFDFVRIYNDKYGFSKPYSNIEFVVSKNFLKKIFVALSVDDDSEWFAETKANDNRVVCRPQNYEQFKKYLKETKIDANIHDVRVIYQIPIYDYEMKTASNSMEIGDEGYVALLEFAKEMLYDDSKQRDEKTENHIKFRFVIESNKIHEEMLAEFNAKYQTQQKQ